MTKITGPLFKWFGSKWTASKYYPEPVFDFIVEPFAGSASYSLRHCHHRVIIYEKNLQLVLLWKWLIGSATEALIREIPVNVSEGTDIRNIGLDSNQALLLKHWQRTNNVGDCWTISPWGNKPGQWTENTRARVAEEMQLIKHWSFESINYDFPLATYFIDPPYQYNYLYKGAYFSHDDLGLHLKQIPHPCQIIACEAEHPNTGIRPTYLPFKEFRRTVTSRRKGTNHHHSNELIFHSINGKER